MLKEVKVNALLKLIILYNIILYFFVLFFVLVLLLLFFSQICYNGCTYKSKLQCNFLSINMSKKMHFISSSSFTNKTENQSGYRYRVVLNVCQNRLVRSNQKACYNVMLSQNALVPLMITILEISVNPRQDEDFYHYII